VSRFIATGVYDEKYDGWRILAYKDGDRVRLVSRNGRDHTARFAGVARAVAELRERLRERPTPACAGVERCRSAWVEPRVVVEVPYNELR